MSAVFTNDATELLLQYELLHKKQSHLFTFHPTLANDTSNSALCRSPPDERSQSVQSCILTTLACKGPVLSVHIHKRSFLPLKKHGGILIQTLCNICFIFLFCCRCGKNRAVCRLGLWNHRVLSYWFQSQKKITHKDRPVTSQ